MWPYVWKWISIYHIRHHHHHHHHHHQQQQQDIYLFVGRLTAFESSEETTEALCIENTLWQNTVLASGRAVGLVLYTGTDTRPAMNTSQPRTKVGLLELELNRLSKVRTTLQQGKEDKLN